MNQESKKCVVWLRRDFRLHDHSALAAATASDKEVILTFVLDPDTLTPFSGGAKPAAYFFGSLWDLRRRLLERGIDIQLIEGNPVQELPRLCKSWGADELYFHRDFEPTSIARDLAVNRACAAQGIKVHALDDQTLLPPESVLNKTGAPYKVFSAYRNECFARLRKSPPTLRTKLREKNLKVTSEASRTLWNRIEAQITRGQNEAGAHLPKLGEKAAHERLKHFVKEGLSKYPIGRDLPAILGTSRLSADLRAGVISPRHVWLSAQESGAPRAAIDTFVSEIVWRDFFTMIGFHFPHVFKDNFQAKYQIKWRNDAKEFKAWCEGRTGFPIVDAGMRELVTTGFMHNRVRMIVASFLTKDLLIDWRWGEQFFLKHLFDADLAINNGNWQWCASTGVDAQPYFRIFNPDSQRKKFDPQGAYIRHWVPEAFTERYDQPIVDHAAARLRTLLAYRPGA